MKKYRIYLHPKLNIEMESKLNLADFTLWVMSTSILLHEDFAILTKHVIFITPVV